MTSSGKKKKVPTVNRQAKAVFSLLKKSHKPDQDGPAYGIFINCLPAFMNRSFDGVSKKHIQYD